MSRPKVQRVADGREGGQKAFAKTVDPDKYKIVRIAAATQFQLSELSGNAVGRADLSILINHPLAGGCPSDDLLEFIRCDHHVVGTRRLDLFREARKWL